MLGVPQMAATADSAIASSMRTGDATQLASAAGALMVEGYFAVTGAEGVVELSGSLLLKADRLAVAAEATAAAQSAAKLDGTLAVTAAEETAAAGAVPKAAGVADAEAAAASQAASEGRLGSRDEQCRGNGGATRRRWQGGRGWGVDGGNGAGYQGGSGGGGGWSSCRRRCRGSAGESNCCNSLR